jgi:hypothetical protein
MGKISTKHLCALSTVINPSNFWIIRKHKKKVQSKDVPCMPGRHKEELEI